MDVSGSVEISRSRGDHAEPAGGLELAWRAEKDIVLLGRVGALALPDESEMRPLAFGGGLRSRRLTVDYAYQSFDALGGTHRVGVRWAR